MTETAPPTETASDVTLEVAVRLLEGERLSLGRAAELAGRTVPEFMDVLGLGGVIPALDSTPVADAAPVA